MSDFPHVPLTEAGSPDPVSATTAGPPEGMVAALLTVLGHQGIGLSLKAADGRYVWANDAMRAMLAAADRPLQGAGDAELLGLAQSADVRAADKRALDAGEVITGEHVLEQAGVRRSFRTVRLALPAVDPSGASGGRQVLSLWWDDGLAREQAVRLRQALAQIESQQQAIDRLQSRQDERTDRLTSVFRAEGFEDHLRRELALSSREHREFTLVALRLDGVEGLVRDHGEAAVAHLGDTVVQRLRSNTRSMDVIARLAPDCFGVLLSGVGLSIAFSRMDQFRRQCADHLMVHDGRPVPFSISVGLASFPHTGNSLEALGDSVNWALHDAVVRGGNRVRIAAIALPDPEEVLADQPKALVSM